MISARETLQKWIKAEIAGKKKVDLPALCEKAQQTLPDSFFVRLGREEVGQLIYLFAQDRVAPYRQGARLRSVLANETLSSVETVTKMSSIFQNWFEQIEEGRKICVLDMTKSDVESAISIRQGRADVEIKHVQFFSKIGTRLLEKQQTVQECWSLKELAAQYKKVFVTT